MVFEHTDDNQDETTEEEEEVLEVMQLLREGASELCLCEWSISLSAVLTKSLPGHNLSHSWGGKCQNFIWFSSFCVLERLRHSSRSIPVCGGTAARLFVVDSLSLLCFLSRQKLEK